MSNKTFMEKQIEKLVDISKDIDNFIGEPKATCSQEEKDLVEEITDNINILLTNY